MYTLLYLKCFAFFSFGNVVMRVNEKSKRRNQDTWRLESWRSALQREQIQGRRDMRKPVRWERAKCLAVTALPKHTVKWDLAFWWLFGEAVSLSTELFLKKVIRLHYLWTNLLAAEENVLGSVTAKAQTSKRKQAYSPMPVGKMHFT